MELRTVDARTLIENPDNPRRKSPPDHADQQMAASIREIGVLQPPVVRDVAEGLMTKYGHRRVRGSIAAKKFDLKVIVLGADEDADDDQMRALIENTVRKNMSPVEQWRAIEALVSERWTEEAISNVLVLPLRTLQKLRLLARIHTPMLDRMHAGDMPGERDLRVIASASLEEQAAAWKKHKPKKGEEVTWWQLAQTLSRQRMRAADAVFDTEFAAAYGVEYVEDLFAPADEDSRATTNVDGFLAAQHAWIEANLPENGVVLQTEQYGGAKLPPKAQRFYGKPGTAGEKVGYCVNERTGQVETVLFTTPAPAGQSRNGRGDAADDTPIMPKTPRPALTQKGAALVGNMRTDALHDALRDAPIDNDRLLALLVLALAGHNVEVKTGMANAAGPERIRREIAATLTEGGVVTSSHAVLQTAARSMLAYTLSCRENWSKSGPLARIAGDAIGADAYLPNMATNEFLSCLSKAAVEGVAVDLNVPVQPTGKATRGAVIARVGEGRWVYPQAVFSEAAEAMRDWTAGGTDAEADEPDGAPLDEDLDGVGLDGDDDDAPAPDAPTEADPALDTDTEVDGELEPDAEPAVPARRHRSRKPGDESQAAA